MGSFTASVAVVLPSFILVLGICKMYNKFQNNHTMESVLTGIKPVVAGLIGAAAGMISGAVDPVSGVIVWGLYLIFYMMGAGAAMWRFGRFSIAAVLSHRD